MFNVDQHWRDTVQAYHIHFCVIFLLPISSSQLVNTRVKIGRMNLHNISIQMDQAYIQTDFQVSKKFTTNHEIRKFITVMTTALSLHHSCARWIQSTPFSQISVEPRFKLFSHLRQYITHVLFIQLFVSLSYTCQLHPLTTLFLFLSPKKYLPKIKDHQVLHYVIFSSHLPPRSWTKVTSSAPYFLFLQRKRSNFTII